MKRKGRITIKKKRRRESKTDYAARLKLLTSGLPRLVVRKSNLYITAQIVESKQAQDSVLCSAHSKELRKFGWQHSAKNLPAAYLTCFLLVKKLEKLGKKEKLKDVKEIKEAILDTGLYRSTKGSRIYACLKGALDAGLQVAHSADILPTEQRLKGEHLSKSEAADFEKVKEKIINEFEDK